MCVGESLAGKVWIVSHSLCDVTLYLAGGYRQRNSSSHTNLTQNSEVQDLYSRAAGTATEFVSLLELTYLSTSIVFFSLFPLNGVMDLLTLLKVIYRKPPKVGAWVFCFLF